MSVEIKSALDLFAQGQMLIVVDDENRENEGDLIVLAEKVTPEQVGFIVRHTTGILCVAMKSDRAQRLHLPLMVEHNQDKKGTAFTISVDAREEITTGVSADDRARTINLLASPSAHPSDFVRPGHIYPLIAAAGGLSERDGHTEAGVALAEAVGATPLALLSEIVNDDGSMARGDQLIEFSKQYQIPIISIEKLGEYVDAHPASAVSESALITYEWAQMPLPSGIWSITTHVGLRGRDHAILRFGDGGGNPLVRIHSECFTGDVLHSLRCDCGQQLESAIAEIQEHGYGYIIYLRDQEGRGIGLGEKIKSYILQDQGLDTVEANLRLGHSVDARTWLDAITIIRSLGIKELTLLTNNPEKVRALVEAGIEASARSLHVTPNQFNEKYLATKAAKLGHTRKDG